MLKNILSLLIPVAFLFQDGLSQENNIQYEILLSNQMLKETGPYTGLIDCMAISPQNLVALSDSSQIYLLGWRGITAIGNKSKNAISGFAYTQDGLLLAVQNDDLCYINKEGTWENLYKLPSRDMSITTGKEVIYAYDRKPNGEKYHVFALAKGGRYMHILESPKPVHGICEEGDSVYLAIESGIYSYSPGTKKLRLKMVMDKGTTITSLTVDPIKQIFYFTTPAAIYALSRNSLVRLTTEFPGSKVTWFGNGLFLFNSSTNDIFRIVNVDSSIEF